MYILCLAMSGPFVDSEHLSDNINDIIYIRFSVMSLLTNLMIVSPMSTILSWNAGTIPPY